jgi:hypothetical protein
MARMDKYIFYINVQSLRQTGLRGALALKDTQSRSKCLFLLII